MVSVALCRDRAYNSVYERLVIEKPTVDNS